MATRILATDAVRRDQIRIYIRTDRSVPAPEAGRLLVAFSTAFAAYAYERTRRRGFRLEIQATGTGTWWVLLIATHEIVDISKDYPDLTPTFINNLSHTIKILTEAEPSDVPRYFRDLARKIGRIGKRAAAEAIDIVNILQISLDPVAFDILDQPEPRRPQTASTPAISLDWKGFAPRLAEAGMMASESRLRGTLHKVGKKWYANAEGMHDVLLPLKLSVLATLTAADGGSYTITGAVQYSDEGHPIAIKVESLKLNDPSPDEPLRLPGR